MKKTSYVSTIMAAAVVLSSTSALLATAATDRIETTATKSYVFATYLKADDIKVSAQNDSVVTLTGTVSEWSHRSLAEETVAGIPGVVRVENKLEVKPGQPAENSDGWISLKVKTMFMFHWNVNGFTTNVETKDGIVTLKGPATNEAQKELYTEYAKDVDGVKGVTNEMIVAKTGKTTVEKMGDYVDDASITAQVKLALLLHRSTSVIKTKVDTKNGVVTVSGVAKNSAEKDLVGKLVNNIKGVKSLKNVMTIG